MTRRSTAKISTGAIGVYSFINRVSAGLKHLMALNRKFDLSCISSDDIIPMTELASKVTGLKSWREVLDQELQDL